MTWRDLEWLRTVTSLPLLVKGILTAEDAALAVKAGVDGVVVSNHGGRQLDGARLARCAAEVSSGRRRGRGAARQRHPPRHRRRQGARAGARAVLVGRPHVFGLAVGGTAASSGCSASCARRSSSLSRCAAARPLPRSGAGTLPGRGSPGAVRAGGIRAADRGALGLGSGGRRDTRDRRRRLRGLRPGLLWPAAQWDVWEATAPMKDLYVGASGIVGTRRVAPARPRGDDARTWLGRAAHPRSLGRDARLRAMGRRPFAGAGGAAHGRERAAPRRVAGRPERRACDRLFARVRENTDSEAVEIMWGAPGTMLAARAMLDWTGEERWADAWRESAQAVWQARDADGLWTNRLYGEDVPQPRPAARPGRRRLALRAGGLFAPDRVDGLERETAAILAGLALTEDGLANWPVRAGAGDRDLRLQWCDGAPGIVAAAAPFLDEELLLGRRRGRLAGGPARNGEGDSRSATARPGTATRSSKRSSARATTLARPRPPVRRARARAGPAARPWALLALDGRRGRRAIRRRLHGGANCLSCARIPGLSASRAGRVGVRP